MQAASALAGQAVRDPAKYKPAVVRSIDQFNQAVEHFRRVGHQWPVSDCHSIQITGLKNMDSYPQFERWLLQTHKRYDRHNDPLPVQT